MTNPNSSHKASASLEINGMSCDHCVARVKKALEGVAGVGEASVRVGRADIDFDPAVASIDAMTAAVTKAGYPAHVAVDTK
jgi:copper chaperone CopZ